MEPLGSIETPLVNIIITSSEALVDVYLMQLATVGEALAILRDDWRFATSQTQLWEISSASDQTNCPKGGMKLRGLGSVGVATVAQAKLNEALYYANQTPEKELDLITQFASQCLLRLKELREGKPVSIAQSQSLVQNEPKGVVS